MTTQERIAYIAGLFDGEGSITIKKWVDTRPRTSVKGRLRGQRTHYELHAEINQVRPESVKFAQSEFGGRVYFRPRDSSGKYSGRWFWVTDSQRAADVLTALRPYLLIKGPEVDVAVRFQKTKSVFVSGGRSRKLGLTADELAEREFCYLELQRLKRVHNDEAVQAEYGSSS